MRTTNNKQQTSNTTTYEPEKDDGGFGMVGVIFVVDTEAADRAGLMADANFK